MRIAIDIDSTLHHYWDRLSDAARRRFGIDLPYEEQLDWGITRLRPDQLRLCVEETHCAEAILAGRPYPDAVETVTRWCREGHYIHITSHRDPQAHAATATWLARIGVPYDDLALGAPLGEVRKRILCLLERKHLVDNWPDAVRLKEFAE